MSIELVEPEDWDGIGPAAMLPRDRAIAFKHYCDTADERAAFMEKWLEDNQKDYGHLFIDEDIDDFED